VPGLRHQDRRPGLPRTKCRQHPDRTRSHHDEICGIFPLGLPVPWLLGGNEVANHGHAGRIFLQGKVTGVRNDVDAGRWNSGGPDRGPSGRKNAVLPPQSTSVSFGMRRIRWPRFGWPIPCTFRILPSASPSHLRSARNWSNDGQSAPPGKQRRAAVTSCARYPGRSAGATADRRDSVYAPPHPASQ